MSFITLKFESVSSVLRNTSFCLLKNIFQCEKKKMLHKTITNLRPDISHFFLLYQYKKVELVSYGYRFLKRLSIYKKNFDFSVFYF